jgi:hypothetical protein
MGQLKSWADEMAIASKPAMALVGPGVVNGGKLAFTIDVAARSSQLNATSAASFLYRMSEECRSRMDACTAYTNAMIAYRNGVSAFHLQTAAFNAALTNVNTTCAPLPPVPVMPNMPTRPGPWAEEG